MNNIIKILLILLFFQGILSIIGVSSTLYKSAIDVLIYLIFIIVLAKNKSNLYIPHKGLHKIFIFYSIIVLFSAVVNESDLFKSFSFYRNTLNGYLFFIAISNIHLKRNEVTQIKRLVFFLILIQPLASLMKFFIIGQSEDYIGTFSLSGGSYSTLVPLLFIPMFYLLWLQTKRKIFGYLILGYIFMAFVGDKRVFWFLLPIVLVLSNSMYKKTYYNRLVKQLKSVISLIIIFPVFIYIGARSLPSLNPDYEIWGTFDLNYLTNYAVDYSLGNNQDSEYGVGRLGSLNSMLFYFNDSNPKTITIGDGPDIFVDKNNEDEVSKDYGVLKLSHFTGIMFYLPSVGILGSLSILFYHILIFFIAKKKLKYFQNKIGIKRIMWISISIMTLIICYDYIFYTKAFVHSNLLNTLFFFLLGALLNKYDCFFINKTDSLINK